MNNIKFYLVFLYTFYTRIKTKTQRVSFLFIYFIPLLLLVCVFLRGVFSLEDFMKFFIAVLGVYSIYELGYIFNDVFAIRKEKDPTLRLSKLEMAYVENNIFTICFVKTFISFLTVIYLQSAVYSIGILFIVILYYLYNKTQGRWRLVIHFFLSSLRYYIPIVVFSLSPWSLLWVVLLFPCINTMERMSEPKFSLLMKDFIFANKKSGRYVYYVVLICLLYPVLLFTNHSLIYLIPFLYFFIYRFFSLKFYEMLNR